MMTEDTDELVFHQDFAAALATVSDDGILVTDTAGQIHAANPAAGRLFGLAPDALQGCDLDSLVTLPRPERGTLDGIVDRLQAVDGRELEIRHSAGDVRTVRVGVAGYTDRDSRRLVIGLRDTGPERRMAEQAQRLRELRCLHALADEVRRDTPFETLLSHVSQQLPNAMANPADARVRLRLDEYEWAPSDWPERRAETVETITVSGETRGEIRAAYSTRSGLEFTEAERGTIRAVAVVLGETMERRRKALELTRYARELESFSYSVSHDLRAPLRALDGFSQALMKRYPEALDERGRDYLNRIRRASVRMSELIDALLRLSRISRSPMAWAPVNLSRVAEEVVEELRASDPTPRVTVRCEPGLRVWGDEPLLRIVLQNLIGNAWKFSVHAENPRIELRADPSKPGRYLVQDNGAGFDPRYADRLFGAFQRLHSEAEFEGMGIGLVTVKRIISRHGGDVGADSGPGAGATFWFELRTATDEEEDEHGER